MKFKQDVIVADIHIKSNSHILVCMYVHMYYISSASNSHVFIVIAVSRYAPSDVQPFLLFGMDWWISESDRFK